MVSIEKLVRERILILDGAMGTMIQRYNLTEEDFRGERFAGIPGQMKGNNDLLCLTRPDVIQDIHRKYLMAGADIIETNTFSSTSVSMADYHVQEYVREMNLAAVRLAREVADEFSTPDKPRFVAGSIGPTNKTCSMSPDVNNPAMRALTYDELADAYREQMEALLEGGVDALLIETIFDTLNAKAAIFAAEKAMEATGIQVPVMLSVTVSDTGGRTLSGQTLEAFLASVQHANIFSVGLNCSFGARQLKPFLEQLAARAPYYISAYPNAGLPNSLGQYDQTPADMAHEVKEYIQEGLINIIGGCCGTTDAYIAEYPALIAGAAPHVPAPKPESLWLSGLELLEVTPEKNFINVGERCNVAGSRKFLRLVNEKKYDEALSIARQQVEDGAQIIDVNMDDGLLDAQAEMTTFLNLIASEPEIARVPVMIDSSKWDVIVAGLKCLQGKSIVNSISLKEGEEKFLEHARTIRQYGAATVVMAFDEKGQADTYERKIEVCARAYQLLVEKVGFNPHDIIFDPNVLAVATGMDEHNNYAVDFIRATGWIRKNLPGAHVSGGVSNLSFSFRGNNYIREAMHAVFLYHAIREGMDMGIVNPATAVLYTDIPADILERIEDVVTPVKDLFGAVFFISVGMMVNPGVIVEYWSPILILSCVVIVGMIIFGTLGMLVTGQNLKVAIESGFTLTQVGEFSFIIASLGMALGVLNPSLYPIIVAVSVLTIFTTPYFIQMADGAYMRIEKHLPKGLNFLISRYSKQVTDSSETKQLWIAIIKRYLWRMLLYSVILLAEIMFSRKFFFPIVENYLPEWGHIVATVLTIIAMLPFQHNQA